MKKRTVTVIYTACIFGILGFIVGFFKGETIYMWYVMPLFSSEMSTFWAAAGALGTISVSAVAAWQTCQANQLTKQISENEIKCTNRPFLAITSIKTVQLFEVIKPEYIGEISITNKGDENSGYEAQGVWNVDFINEYTGELAIIIDFTNIGEGIAKEIFATKKEVIPMVSAYCDYTNCLGRFLQKDKTTQFIIALNKFDYAKGYDIDLYFTYENIHDVPFNCVVSIIIAQKQIVIMQRGTTNE